MLAAGSRIVAGGGLFCFSPTKTAVFECHLAVTATIPSNFVAAGIEPRVLCKKKTENGALGGRANVGNAMPRPEDMAEWVPRYGNNIDIVVVGMQVSSPSPLH